MQHMSVAWADLAGLAFAFDVAAKHTKDAEYWRSALRLPYTMQCGSAVPLKCNAPAAAACCLLLLAAAAAAAACLLLLAAARPADGSAISCICSACSMHWQFWRSGLTYSSKTWSSTTGTRILSLVRPPLPSLDGKPPLPATWPLTWWMKRLRARQPPPVERERQRDRIGRRPPVTHGMSARRARERAGAGGSCCHRGRSQKHWPPRSGYRRCTAICLATPSPPQPLSPLSS